MEKRLKKSRYITGFDGIRSIAVIGVILYHLLPDQLQGGYLGVPVFFVVSGYLITDLMVQEWQQNGKIKIKQFYYRRMKRLYPALVAMMIGASAYITLFQRNLLNNLRGNVVSSLLYYNNWWQIKHGLSYFDRFAGESPFTHIWSLAVESQYYLFLPWVFIILMKLVKNKGKIFIGFSVAAFISAILMALMYTPGQDPTRAYYGTDTRMFSILLGVALAFVWPSTRLKTQIPAQAKKILNGVGLGSLVILVLSFFFLSDKLTFIYYGGMYLLSLVSVILVAITAHPGASLNRWLTNPVFTWIGKRSYGIYLYQFPVMIFYEAKVHVANHVLLNTVVEILLILFVTELSYRFIEKPLRYFDYRNTLNRLQAWILAPWKSKQKMAFIAAWLVTVIALVGIVISPTNHVTADQRALQEKIAQNQKVVAQKEKTANQKTASSEATSESKTMANKYHLTDREIAKAKNLKLTAFGDSVLLDAADGLNAIFPQADIDGEVGRQLVASPELLQKLKAEGKLHNTVLLALGTNGSFTEDEFAQVMKVLGSKRDVYVVNVYVPTRRWQNEVNTTLAAMSKKYDNVKLIDWYDLSKNQPSWFYEDQVHPNPTGSIYYCSLVSKAILKGR
ncbi:acyltransferase family protein [Enterococcus sp. CSURQ0835]|uniref:acyltransferase family protein n=1 Tax=Enterococcus sp. CSURQ0835 TaxID=2681394 RepID=UPI00135A7979|nr:acyltransferase family protein [Enterococcus sp. CSURQ0835]